MPESLQMALLKIVTMLQKLLLNVIETIVLIYAQYIIYSLSVCKRKGYFL